MGDKELNKYSGYVYDAVWLYAIALDNLIKYECSQSCGSGL